MKKILIGVAILAAIVIVLGLLVPARALSHGRTPWSRCTGNLSSLGKSMSIYAMDHEEKYPATFVELAPDYAMYPKLYHCPLDTNQVGEMTDIDAWSSYTLIPRTPDSSPDMIHAFCNTGNHKRKRVCVLFVDGSVEGVKREEFEKLLKEQEPEHPKSKEIEEREVLPYQPEELDKGMMKKQVKALLDAYAGADDLMDEALLAKRAELEALGASAQPALIEILRESKSPQYKASIVGVFIRSKGKKDKPLKVIRQHLKENIEGKYNVFLLVSFHFLVACGEEEDIDILDTYVSSKDRAITNAASVAKQKLKERIANSSGTISH